MRRLAASLSLLAAALAGQPAHAIDCKQVVAASVYAPALAKSIQRADLGPILAVLEPR